MNLYLTDTDLNELSPAEARRINSGFYGTADSMAYANLPVTILPALAQLESVSQPTLPLPWHSFQADRQAF